MSHPRAPKPAKLVMSFLYREEEALAEVLAAADGNFGPLDFLSETLPFEFTSYYEAEMGKHLKRRLAAFRPLIFPPQLPEIKVWANGQENRHLDERGGRKINIDPGYLAPAKFILATGKDYSHRIYLGDGIYGDLTLMFQKGAFITLPWTYPDYGSSPLIDLITLIRKRLLWQMKNAGFQGRGGQGAER
jgi:hypothetical protein